MKMFRNGLAKSLMAVGLLVATTAACDRAKSAEKAPPPPTPVVVAEVVQHTVPIVRDFTARTEAVPTVEVRARIAGVIERVAFEEGTQVTAGQTLFVIQPEEYGGARVRARSARQGPGRRHEGTGRLDHRAGPGPARPAQGRSREGPP